jgi:hypothetical protein
MEPPAPEGHDLIEELMAGYALRSLSGRDAAEADRLLSEHVPGCARCRATLLAFTDAVADLALSVDPIEPPETLLPRLHRELEPRTRRPVAARWVGVAAGVVVVVIAGGLAVSQGMRAGDLERRADLFAQALSFSQRPDAESAPLVGTAASGQAPVSQVTAPDVDHFYLVGKDVPPAPPGATYGIWLAGDADAVFAGTFVPAPGLSVVKVPFDRSRFDRVLITLEGEGTVPTEPGQPVWEAAA